MYIEKTTITIRTNHMIQGNKKPVREIIGKIELDNYLDAEGLSAICDVLTEKVYNSDPVMLSVNLEMTNS